MAKNTVKTSKSDALSLARQQHTVIREFLNQESVCADLLKGLKDAKGENNELILLSNILNRESPISADHVVKYYDMAKSTASNAAKELSEYLKEFSNTIEPLKAKRKTICIPRQEGGINVGYHLACFDTKTKKYLDGPATRKLFEKLWDDFIGNELRKKLEQEAGERLLKKLEDRDDYQPLGMEIGIVPQKSQRNMINEPRKFGRSEIYNHNRTWESFNIDDLLKPGNSSPYIVSVDAGGGKTTFLRHLQLELLHRTELIPIFIDASKIEEWKSRNSRQFVEKLVDHFELNLPGNRVIDFLVKALNEKIVLLVDGLDQIKAGGSEYECVAHHIAELMKKNVIITSRPSAVINLEDENAFTFLRLKPFRINAQKNYFGNNYKRAKQLSRNTNDLVAIPMLAHMVRTLIEEKQDENINNRTQLYQRFISYILTKYKHGNTKLIADTRTQTRMSLGKIAYDALAEKKPYIQKIPLDFCYEKNRTSTEKKEGFGVTSGLANLILERSGCEDKDCLFFTHQSFQEYFAAEYAAKDENRIQRILSEKWNPKWKEVIKFLTGIKGQEIIEEILSEKDNPIHSKLFLSAELVSETKVSSILRKDLSQKIEQLFENLLFVEDAERFWVYVEEVKAIKRILSKQENNSALATYTSVIKIIDEFKNQTDNGLIEKLREESEGYRDLLLGFSDCISLLKSDNSVMKQVIERFGLSSPLINLSDKIDKITIKKLVNLLGSDDTANAKFASCTIERLINNLGEDMTKELVYELVASQNEISYILLKKLYKKGKLKFLEQD